MKFEPSVDHDRLRHGLRSAFGLGVDRLTFVPLGFDAASYVVECADGSRIFLKRWPHLANDPVQAARRRSSLQLARAIHDRRLLKVAYPIRTRDGDLWFHIDGVPLALFPFLPGQSPPEELPASLWAAYGQTMAAIHRATDQVRDALPAPETFELLADVMLSQAEVQLAAIGPNARPGLIRLQDFFHEFGPEISGQLDRLARLQTEARLLAASGPMVLCHGDFGADNMLVEDGQIAVLDWDYPNFAPPEHDLWCAALLDGCEEILYAYLKAGGERRLNIAHFAFALLRRALCDMAARVNRLLEPGNDGSEDEELLEGMVLWGVDQWRLVDERLVLVRSAFKSAGLEAS